MSNRGEDCVGGVALAAFEIAAAEMSVGLHVSDHGFDGGAAFELALDGTVDATLLAGDEDTAWVRRIVAAVSLTWGDFGSRSAIQPFMNKTPLAISVSKVRAPLPRSGRCSPDQPHIRSPFMAAAPISRLRRARLGWTRPFCRPAFEAIGIRGSSTRIRQN